MRQDGDSDLDFFQVKSISGRFAQQWKLRTVAQGAPSKGIANSELQSLSADDEAFECADV